MPKHKKPKTRHSNSDQISQAEVWDDSALLRSWDDAVAEYQYYHSLQARGEDIDKVLRKAELYGEANGEVSEEGEIDSDNVEDEVVDDSEIETKDSRATGVEQKETVQNSIDVPQKPLDDYANQKTQAPPPNLQVSSNDADQTLENIKMSYYWAGYYSGLYDGQRQQVRGSSGTATNQPNAQNDESG